MSILTLWKTRKEDGDVQLVGQSTSREVLENAANILNDNAQFVKKADGSIFGNNSSFEIFSKDELRSASIAVEDEDE